ncbi:MAG: MFS transporter [Candidatus Thorarchaeota archaeon]
MSKKSLSGLSSFQILAYFRRGLFYSFLSIYLYYQLGLSVTESTLFATFSMIASSIAQSTIWGTLADKVYNRKFMVFWSEIGAALCIFVVWWIHYEVYFMFSPYLAGWVITFGLTFTEMVWSASNVAWTALLSDLTPQNRRSSLMGSLSAIGGLGRILGVASASLLFLFGNVYGGGFLYGPLFFVTCIVIVTTAFIILFTINDSDLIYRTESSSISTYENTENYGENDHKFNSRKSFNSHFFLLFIISLALVNFGRNSITQILNYFLISKFNASIDLIGSFEIISSISFILAGIATPFLVKLLGDWRLYLVITLEAIISLIGFVLSPNIYLAVIFSFGIRFVHVIIQSTSYSIVAAMVPSRLRGKYFGYYNTVFFLSFGIGGTLVTGPISDFMISVGYDPTTAYTTAFFSAAIIVLCGLLLGIYLFKNLRNYNMNEPNKINS